ncbi:MAG: ABC transporter substrate-binding protein [Roseivivax sp.]|nr:ABC transporter substrate-binding protein [Roseivivax sp.]
MGGLFALGAVLAADRAIGQDEAVTKSHGYSYFGNLDYPADFTHFNFVNPDAPKGGEIAIGASGTFDSMNPYSRKGRSGVLTTIQYDQLIESSEDSVGQYYGILAESLEYPESRDWVIFHMRPEATFWDGTPVTAEDVVYSHKLFITQGLPSYAQAVGRMVTSVEALDAHTVKFTFNPDESKRSRIETVGSTPVFSKAWFEADPKRRLDEPRLEVAVGSGPYKLESFDINRQIIYKRRDDYWGKDLPFNKGRFNYDTIRVEYFADQTASFEAFKAGEYTIRVESDPKLWASGYDFPKVADGTVAKIELPDGSPPNPTGFVFNLSKPQFADKRVRQAFALAFNFEWTNESLLFGLYSPRSSFVQGTPIEAKDVPQGKELAFLQTLGDVVPAEVLNEPVWTMHASDAATLADRGNMRQANRLLNDAGWTVGDDGVRRNAEGQELAVLMLYPTNIDDSVDAMHDTYAQNLEQLGIKITLDKVDPSQYTERRRERQFDMLYSTIYDTFLSTGGGLTQMYGSNQADSLFNPGGLASPMVDAIIEASFVTTNQEDQDTALMALDRALRYEFFIVPTGYIANYWVAAYDMYAHPESLPPYALGYLDLWWIDPDRAKALKESGALK